MAPTIGDLDEVFKPVTLIWNVFGLMPYISEKMSERYKQSVLNIVQRFFYVVIYVALLCNTEIKKSIHEDYFVKSGTLQFLSYFNFVAKIFVMACVLIMNQIHAKRTITVIDTLLEIDKDFIRLGQQKKLLKYNYYAWRLEIILMVLIFGVYYGIIENVITYLVERNFSVIQLLVYLYPTFVNATLKITFAAWMVIIRFKFVVINEMLEKYREDSLNKHNYPANSYNFIKITTHLVDQHKVITKMAKEINFTYGFQLLASITITFVLIVADSYMALYSIMNGIFNYFVVLKITETLYLSFELLFLVSVSASICKEANNTKTILLGFKIDPSKIEPRNTVVASCFQLMHNKLEITASKLFNIDYTLVFSVFAAATTYLYIMLQFESGDKDKTIASTLSNITNETEANATDHL